MMHRIAHESAPYEIPGEASLHVLMLDGTGMCGGCRVNVGGKNKFACVDGLEFDGHLVDFNLLMDRLTTYRPYEQEALKEHEEGCKIGLEKANPA